MSHAEYLNDYEAKHQILEVGRRMYEKGFVASNDGNISCRVSETELWTTPTGVSKGFMTEEMLVKVDLDGNLLSGERKPSSEIRMHLRVYRENPQVKSVVHAHPPVATSFAIAGISLSRAIRKRWCSSASFLSPTMQPPAHRRSPIPSRPIAGVTTASCLPTMAR